MIGTVSRLQADFILAPESETILDVTLQEILKFSESELGLIAEVLEEGGNSSILALAAASNSDRTAGAEAEFRQSFFDQIEESPATQMAYAAIKTGERIISSDAFRRPGLPPINPLIVVPLKQRTETIATIAFLALANRPAGYDQTLIDLIQPLTTACTHFLIARRGEKQKLAALDDARQAKEAAIRANHAKSTFLANMSHELRTRLNAIIGFSNLLFSGESDPSKKENLRIVATAGQDLLRLIQQILDLSKIEAGKVQEEITDFAASDVLNSVVSMFQPQVEAKGIKISVRIYPSVPTFIRGDHGSLRQVLINIIGNAVKFTTKGEIKISLLVAENPNSDKQWKLLFQVSDSGIGIKPENIERIFSMFEQEDASMTKRFGGTGLGLAIAKRLVEMMGGEIWVESVSGIGSRFSFTIKAEMSEHRGGAIEVPWSAGTVSSGKRILVVEDDLFSQSLITQILRGVGYEFECAEDGSTALSVLQRGVFDLVLMDIQLPVLSGIEAFRIIRENPDEGWDPAIPVIALTAYALRGSRERFMEEGFSAYISKPIDADELLKTINEILQNDRVSTASVTIS